MKEIKALLLNKFSIIALVLIIVFFVSPLLLNNDGNNNNQNNNQNNEVYTFKDFNQCLADSGFIIYGSEWCPACASLVETLGGSRAVEPVYVDCTTEEERCLEETKTSYIPEIQLDGEVYEGSRSLSALSDLTGCELPNQKNI